MENRSCFGWLYHTLPCGKSPERFIDNLKTKCKLGRNIRKSRDEARRNYHFRNIFPFRRQDYPRKAEIRRYKEQ